ncbi:hypothetical protein BDP27DRAFT_1312875 [Rhodocollybia butyracea]|uniref:NAD(P)-binding protein n=1 Tax=Rhodocollybia butyracea TaxID=206335 RepID=A0A9P5UF67_9AGAR|nr:hypothetical protein BDP27DRAFT_1312875 [Rhodocollybia butyracea]
MFAIAEPIKTKPIRLGFIGLSATGPLSSDFSLVAVSTTNTDSAQASAKKYSELSSNVVKPYYGSAEHIAADKDIDMLVVSVRVTHHKEVALKAIKGGKDLFIEWPAGKSLEETKEIYEAAMRMGVKTVVGFQSRFNAYALKTKSIIESGEIGKIITSSFTVSLGFPLYGPTAPEAAKYLLNSSNGVTLVDLLGGHMFDLLTYILGPISSLTALLQNQIPLITIIGNDGKPTGETVPYDGANQVCVSGVLVSGAVFNVNIQSGAKQSPDFNWVIHGENGTVRIIDDDRMKVMGFFDASPEVYLNGTKVELEDVGVSALPVNSEKSSTTATGLAWKAYADGKSGTYATLEQALKMKEVIAAMKKSSEEGRRIHF